ncbi:MAG: hypothetical protein ACREOU_16130 [Candidatus Eiseniibacteriota bacterium]
MFRTIDAAGCSYSMCALDPDPPEVLAMMKSDSGDPTPPSIAMTSGPN